MKGSSGGIKTQAIRTPEQEALWGMFEPFLQSMFGGEGAFPMPSPGMFQMPTGAMPTAGWYEGLDPMLRQGIEEPYQRGLNIVGERLQGMGMLGAPSVGASGVAADVMGQYATQAAPRMAMSGWEMLQPQRQALMQQAWMPYQQAMMPYGVAMQGLGQAMPSVVGGATPGQQSIFPDLLSMIGTIAGSYVGGPPGGAVGGSAGSIAGRMWT